MANNLGTLFTNIANAIRTKNGQSTTYYPNQMAAAILAIPTGGGTPVLQNKTKSYTPTETAQSETITADTGYDGLGQVSVSVGAIAASYIGSAIVRRNETDLSASGAIVTVPAGYYEEQETKSVANGTAGTPTATKGTVSNHSISVTPSVTNTTGYITGGTKTGTAVSVSASELVSGNKAISQNGANIDVVNYSTVSVSVNAPTPTLQTKTVTPNESAQTITADTGYDGLEEVDVEAISSTYIGSEITRNPTMTASGATVTAPVGYYDTAQTKTVSSGTAGTPTATKGTVSNNSVSVTPSVINTTGWITGGTKTGTAVTVSASELVSGNKAISENGTGIDVTNYSTVSVSVQPSLQTKSVTPSESVQTITPDTGYYGLEEVDVGAISSTYVGSGITRNPTMTTNGATVTAPVGYYSTAQTKTIDSGSAIPAATISATGATLTTGTNTLTLSKSVSNTPVVTEGYVESGTAGNSSVSLTATVNTRSSSDLTASGATVTAPAGYYGSAATKSVDTMTLPTSAVSSATTGYTSKATIGRSTSAQYINIPPGYNSAGAYYTISAVANGSATGPTSLSGSSATLTTGTNTLTLTKTGVTTTPTVSAGYVSSATASTATVTLTASVTTKAATTYYATTSDQTISASQYLTGAQTIKALSQTNLSAANIKSGTTISVSNGNGNVWSVAGTYTSDATANASDILNGETAYVGGEKITGNLSLTTVYTGSSAPSSSLGSNGDIYIQS